MSHEFEIEVSGKPETITISDLWTGELAIIDDDSLEGSEVEDNGKYIIKTFESAFRLDDFGNEWAGDSEVRVRRVANATVTLTFGSGS